MIPTKRIWAARPLLAAYVVIVGFTIGLLVNRSPGAAEAVIPAAAELGDLRHAAAAEREGKEPPLWMQLFRPSQPTARLMLRMGLPLLAIADGSAVEMQKRALYVYWTGRAAEKPQTLFQVLLPFLREPPAAAAGPISQPAPDNPPAPEAPVSDPAPTSAPGSNSAPASPARPNQAPGSTAPSNQGGAKPAAADTKVVVNGGLPLVGIYHTHDYESYLSEFPSLQPRSQQDLMQVVSYDHAKRTVVELGNTLAVRLRDLGITTVHAPGRHQDQGYDFAYKSSRSTAREILKKAPSTRILIDIHRDGVWGLNTRVMVAGKPAAKIRCIIGSVDQPHWVRNKVFCDELMERMEKRYPGITLPTRVQEDTYNQDLLPGAILFEIGGATNRYDEAERSVTYIAQVLAEMIREGEYPK